MSQVRAKFKCVGVSPNNTENPEGFSVTLHPVISGSAENEEFYKWTPGGQVALSLVSADTAAKFIEGKEYYVDFSEAIPEVAEETPAVSEAPQDTNEVE